MKHKRDDGAEKHDDETVDVTPIMICVFVVMCCSMLVLLYFFYDHLGTLKFYFNTTRLPLLQEQFYCRSDYETAVFYHLFSLLYDLNTLRKSSE